MEIKVVIRTLTPIWTGGAETGKCDRIHETGILGSLRWWMEVLVRGLGGEACDPTDQKCLYDPNSKKPNNGICKVCEVFGATNWKRRFRLEIKDEKLENLEIQHYQRYEKEYSKIGTFTIQIQSLYQGFNPEIIGGLIQFIANWSALGSRLQMGFGIIAIENGKIDMQPLYNWLIATSTKQQPYLYVPSLKNIFLARIQLENLSSLSIEQERLNLKSRLRDCFRTTSENQDNLLQLRHFIMGTVPNKTRRNSEREIAMAAKVKISHVYCDDANNKLIRVWGWIPEKAKPSVYNKEWNREKVVSIICEYLKSNYTLSWYEIKPPGITKPQTVSDVKIFLRSLLQL